MAWMPLQMASECAIVVSVKARNPTVTHALVKPEINKRLRQTDCDIAKIVAAILAVARQDPRRSFLNKLARGGRGGLLVFAHRENRPLQVLSPARQTG